MGDNDFALRQNLSEMTGGFVSVRGIELAANVYKSSLFSGPSGSLLQSVVKCCWLQSDAISGLDAAGIYVL